MYFLDKLKFLKPSKQFHSKKSWQDFQESGTEKTIKENPPRVKNLFLLIIHSISHLFLSKKWCLENIQMKSFLICLKLSKVFLYIFNYENGLGLVMSSYRLELGKVFRLMIRVLWWDTVLFWGESLSWNKTPLIFCWDQFGTSSWLEKFIF